MQFSVKDRLRMILTSCVTHILTLYCCQAERCVSETTGEHTTLWFVCVGGRVEHQSNCTHNVKVGKLKDKALNLLTQYGQFQLDS